MSMNVTIQLSTGTAIVLPVAASTSVSVLKDQIRQQCGKRWVKQLLLFNGQILEDACFIGDYLVLDGSVIYLLHDVRVGASQSLRVMYSGSCFDSLLVV